MNPFAHADDPTRPGAIGRTHAAMLPRLLAALLLLLLITVAACEDDDRGQEQANTAAETATSTSSAAATANPTRTAGAAAPASPSGARSTVPELVKQVRPSVVRVQASGGTGILGQQNSGTGTGFVIDKRGYIVTNNHVVTMGGVREASSVQVDFADGRRLNARIVGRDERSDIAVLKVEGGDFTALEFADPSSIQVGEEVVAMGFALDLGAAPTVSKGVVSALDRVIEERLEGTNTLISISGAIQTDAAINPGNSGGPLLDLDGRVLGINTAGLAGGVGSPVQGISFAVSSQVAQPIVTALIESGRVERGWIGIGARTVNRDIAQANQLGVDEGAVLVQVVPGSPAERAGLRTRDVITKIGDQQITNVGDITNALVRRGSGERVTVEYVRGSDRRTAELTLGEPPRG